MKNYLIVIIGMMLVTYIPRLIPLAALSSKKLPAPVRRFLLFIPYTALGALIVPGVANATPDKPAAALVGIGAGTVCAWLRPGLILPVAVSIAATFLVLCL